MNGAIIYLVRTSDEDIIDLKDSINSVRSNLPKMRKYPIICFVEESFHHFEFDIDVTWVYIKFDTPNIPGILEFYPHPTHGNGPVAYGHPGFTLGYRHMCRFFSGKLYEETILDKFDYYLRLDTDSKITGEYDQDLFEILSSNNAVYGYTNIENDNPKVIERLWETCQEYFKNKKLPEYPKMYSTNFEVGKIAFFRSPEYKAFFEHLDKTGNFFLKRWGDAPVKWIGVNMISPTNQIKIDIPYHHGTVKQIEKELKYV